MRNGKNGSIGFMEAMTGTMTVCIVLTAFTAFAATMVSNDGADRPEDFDWSLADDAKIVEDSYIWDIRSKVVSYMDRNGIQGMTATCGSSGMEDLTVSEGDTSGDPTVLRRMVSVSSDDGRTVPTVFEVRIWY